MQGIGAGERGGMDGRALACRFGTAERSPVGETVVVGDMAFILADGALAALTWRGVEVVRGIICLVRDEDWGTYLAQDVVETIERNGDAGTFEYRRRFSVADGALAGEFTFTADPSGELAAVARLVASRDFRTSRAGLTLLHPIEGVSGTRLDVTHPDGTVETTHFPALISPSQPVFAIAGLAHAIDGIDVRLRFAGEVFEMEDQRNWSDASFKTYCRPLGLPCPYVIARGGIVEQSIHVKLSGRPVRRQRSARAVSPGRMPEIMLALTPHWLPDAGLVPTLGRIGAGGLLLRIEADDRGSTTALESVAALAGATAAGVDLELVLRSGTQSPLAALRAVAAQCAAAGLAARNILALPQAYLRNYQPGDPPPAGPTPEDCVAAARDAFSTARVGAGMMTNFTEFNRRRPRPGQGDYVTHGSMATVHAADDRSVLETLEALPQILASGRAIAGDRPYRLGLVSIGMRTNPHSAGVDPNHALRRRTMAENDPRQRGLFAASYAVGVAAAAAFGTIEALALAAPIGPFGVMDDEPGALRLRPIFHALRALSAMSGVALTRLSDLPQGVVGMRDDAGRVIVANCSLEPGLFRSAVPLDMRVLDAHSFAAAAIDADWSVRSPSARLNQVALEPCACLFATT